MHQDQTAILDETPEILLDGMAQTVEEVPEEAVEQIPESTDELLSQIEALRVRLDSAERTAREISAGWRELSELYPDADISSMPDSFNTALERGIPPAAAYALEMRRREVEQARIEAAAERSRKMSAGKIKSADDNLYSPAEVRAMSPSEVKNNIEKIRRSMKSWR